MQRQVVPLLLAVALWSGCASKPQKSTGQGERPFPAQIGQDALEQQVTGILASRDNIKIRSEIAPVFELADRYAAQGKALQAITYYTAALTHKPWQLDAQLKLARLLAVTGDTNGAMAKTQIVWDHSESDALLKEAADILGKPFRTDLPNQNILNAATITLVPIGTVDAWLLLDVRDKLQSALNVPVAIEKRAVGIPPPNREPLHLKAEELRQLLQRYFADVRNRRQFEPLGINLNDLPTDEAVFAAVEKILRADPDRNKLRNFQDEMALIRRLGPQWDAARLMAQLRPPPQLSRTPRASLGVTKLDLFADNSRYVFGLAATGGNHGVFSYRRFTAAVLDEPDNRLRLSERAFKQALSSAGNMFGLPRCTQPTCARAYPNSLPEHDAKSVNLCEQCRGGFEKRFKQ